MNFLSTLLQDSLALIAPHHCLLCSKLSEPRKVCRNCSPRYVSRQRRCIRCWESCERGTLLCAPCLHLPLPWRRQRFVSWYRDEARDILHKIKFQYDQELAQFLGVELARRINKLFPSYDWDVLVSVPSSPQNYLERGFHICDIIVAEIARQVPQATPMSGLFTFHAQTRNQGGKTIADRLSSPLRRLSLSNASQLNGAHVLLVDDVVTTGSTLYAAYKALRAANVREVDILTFCRSERWREYRSHLLRYK
jgi:ComF family protein